MKKRVLFFLVLTMLMVFTGVVLADDPPGGCTTIQSGELIASDGNVIVVGYDGWGYNYQAHMFNGGYCDAYRDAAWCQDYKEDNLSMKWNDAWLSNMDCDGDSKLDRHFGFDSYIGSGAWLTNHQSGEYEVDGKVCKWTYFVKIVAVPEGATFYPALDEEGNPVFDLWGYPIYYWIDATGVEIGTKIWREFAVIQEVYNDPCDGYHGVYYLSPDHAGFGGW